MGGIGCKDSPLPGAIWGKKLKRHLWLKEIAVGGLTMESDEKSYRAGGGNPCSFKRNTHGEGG